MSQMTASQLQPSPRSQSWTWVSSLSLIERAGGGSSLTLRTQLLDAVYKALGMRRGVRHLIRVQTFEYLEAMPTLVITALGGVTSSIVEFLVDIPFWYLFDVGPLWYGSRSEVGTVESGNRLAVGQEPGLHDLDH